MKNTAQTNALTRRTTDVNGAAKDATRVSIGAQNVALFRITKKSLALQALKLVTNLKWNFISMQLTRTNK